MRRRSRFRPRAPDGMDVGDRDEHDRLPMQVDAVEMHHVMRRPVQRHRRL